MQYRHLVLCLVVFVGKPDIFAQQHIIDSLEQQIGNPNNGLSQVEILNELGWYYALSDAEKGVSVAERAIDAAKKAKDSTQLAIAYERKGFCFQNMGKDSLTIAMYDISEQIYKNILDSKRLAALTFNKGNFYLFRSKYTKSLKEGEKALRIFEGKKDSVRTSRVLNQLGLNHLYLGNYSISLETFKKGQLLLELSKNEETQFYAEILGNTALLHEKLNEYDKALKLQKRALAIHQKIEYSVGISNTLSNIGKLYGRKGDHEKALAFFFQSMAIKEKMGNPYRIANGLTNLGLTLSELKRYPEAIENLDKAKNIYKSIEHFGNLAAVHKNMGDIMLALKRPKKALFEFENSLDFASKSGDKRAIFLAKEGLSKSYFAINNLRSAYILQAEASTLKDSLLSNEKRDEVAKIEAKFEYEKEKAVLQATFEKDKALNTERIERQVLIRNTAIGGGIFGMVALVIGFILVKRKKESDFKAKLSQSKLQTIQAQLNPHFIFNTLNSINDFIQKNEVKPASKFLIRFSKMMRSVLDFSKAQEISLAEEIEFLEDYIKLEQQRLNHNFKYAILVEEKIDKDNILIPPSILQPFVENSIWHGLSQREGNQGKLSIEIDKNNDDSLICIIKDNGLGLPNSAIPNKKHKSFGTSSVQERLDLLNDINGSTPNKVEIISLEKGVKVVLTIPFTIDTDE